MMARGEHAHDSKSQPTETLEPELPNQQRIHRPVKTEIKPETQVQQISL
jgi:hypothetical protein